MEDTLWGLWTSQGFSVAGYSIVRIWDSVEPWGANRAIERHWTCNAPLSGCSVNTLLRSGWIYQFIGPWTTTVWDRTSMLWDLRNGNQTRSQSTTIQDVPLHICIVTWRGLLIGGVKLANPVQVSQLLPLILLRLTRQKSSRMQQTGPMFFFFFCIHTSLGNTNTTFPSSI